VCESEDEARARGKELIAKGTWSCYFFDSDTTGEKDFEEFYTDAETLDMERFESIGVIKNDPLYDEAKLQMFEQRIAKIKDRGRWNRSELIDLFNEMVPTFHHKETGMFLDDRM